MSGSLRIGRGGAAAASRRVAPGSVPERRRGLVAAAQGALRGGREQAALECPVRMLDHLGHRTLRRVHVAQGGTEHDEPARRFCRHSPLPQRP